MSKERKIEIRSDEVNDILTKTPAWMVRSGSILMLGVLLLIFAGSALFKYPDIINAPIVITSQNLPAQLIAKKPGSIKTIISSNGAFVEEGDVIAILENPGIYEHYLKVKEICNEYPNIQNKLPENLQLGDIQQVYSQFVKSYREYLSFISLDYHAKMISSIRKEIAVNQEQLRISERRVRLAQKQFSNAEKLYNREKKLFNERAISQQELDKAEGSFLMVAQQMESAKEELNLSTAALIKSKQAILDLELDKEMSVNELKRAVEANYSLLLSQLREWEQLNLFVAPVNGNVSFTSFWQENQNVTIGEVVFTILPEKEKMISGKIYLPMSGAGKVEIGQRVNVKLDSYPYMEYGMVESFVTSISLLPASVREGRAYIVSVNFPDGLKTTYSLELNFGEEMHGIAQVITEEASLLRRVLYPLKHLFNTHF